MNRRHSTTTILAMTALVAALAGCSSTDEPDATAPDSSSVTTPADNAQQTTSPPADQATSTHDSGTSEGSTSTDGGAEASLPTVPTDYADTLVRAWGSGDQTMVARMATAEVEHILGDQGDSYWDQTSAEGAAGSTLVTYTNTESGDTLELRVDSALASQGADHAVVEARYTAGSDSQDALPTVPEDYADTLVVAWGEGDQATMQRMATAEVLHILGDAGGPHWDRISAEGAAGSTVVTYNDTESGDTLTLRVENQLAAQGAEHAVVEARYDTN